MDPEGLTYSTTILSGPSYAQVVPSTPVTQVRFYPTNCFADIGNYDIYIKLED